MVEFLKAELLPRGELAQENAQKIYIYVEGTLAVTKCSSTHTCKETTWAWAVTAGDENRQGNL